MELNTISPVCVSCGSRIGDMYPIYITIREQRVKERSIKEGYKPYDPAALSGILMDDVLQALKIENLCCRKTIIGFIRTPHATSMEDEEVTI